MLPFGLYRVSGESMLPALRPGMLVLGMRRFKPKAGQVVIVWRERPLIKRIERVSRDAVWVVGDNEVASTDSRHFGPLPLAQLEAKIIARLG